ncbi:MAG: alpha/beta hydrolase [Bacteroidales bacterium]|nr:alpha/beta hydrolase [Bacteroidales bacterium]
MIFISFQCYSQAGNSPEIVKQTFVYSIKGQDTLRLDKYYISPEKDSQPKTCILFVFGGGFATGSRENVENIYFMSQLAKKGYIPIAIDYRLGMKNLQKTDPVEVASALINSITLAVEDLYDATSFVYDHAQSWNINRNQIIACGSSAGAITVLQGEYLICMNNILKQKLPDNFRYGGIISFAGAILKPVEENEWVLQPSPIQMFHGNADSNVPYNKLEEGPVGLYGSFYLAERLDNINAPYYFYQVNNAGHEIAGLPMKDNLNEIDSFIRKLVIGKQNLQIRTIVNEIGKPEKNKDFTIMDYIRSNYSN